MNHIRRRDFLKIMGAAAGTVVLPSGVLASFAPEMDLFAPKLLEGTIGLMLPASSLYPEMANSFASGFNLHLRGSGVKVVRENIVSPIPVGPFRKLASQKIDAVVGLVNSGAAASLLRMTPEAKTPFLAANIGEVMPRHDELTPKLFHCTLNYWQAGWTMGKWAAEKLGRRTCVVSSLHDSGYDAIHAFRLGFESSGGRLLQEFVTHSREGLRTAVRDLERLGPDFVYAAYSGPEASDFLKEYGNARISKTIPLAGSAFLLEAVRGSDLKNTAVHVCSPLGLGRDRSVFDNEYKKQTGCVPDLFSVLGYETAKCIATALTRSGGSAQREDLFVSSLKKVRFEGLRGTIEMDPVSHSTCGPLYLGRIKQNGPSGAVLQERAIAAHAPQVKPLFTAMRTGWNNPYLCV